MMDYLFSSATLIPMCVVVVGHRAKEKAALPEQSRLQKHESGY